jgi:hypothetical protein
LVVLEQVDQLLDLAFEIIDPGTLLVGQRRCLQRNAAEPPGLRVADPAVERGPDECKTELGRSLRGQGLHLLAREPLQQRNVEPARGRIIGEQIALDASAGSDIGSSPTNLARRSVALAVACVIIRLMLSGCAVP